MADLSNVIHILPTMKSGDDLLSSMEVLPEYDESEVTKLLCVSWLFLIFIGYMYHPRCHWRFTVRYIWPY